MRHVLAIVAALTFATSTVVGSAASPLDDIDIEACAFVAGLTEPPRHLADYVVNAAVFDIDGDGAAERLSIEDEGTAHFEHFQVATRDGKPIEVKDAMLDDAVDEDWRWMMGERWLLYDGRAYVVRTAGRELGYIRYLSRIGSDFIEYPLCKFQPRTRTLFYPLRKADRDLCDAVKAGTLAYEPVTRYPKPKFIDERGVPGGTAALVGETRLDFDNSGRPTRLFLYEMNSAAGAGCGLSYYDTAYTDPPTSVSHLRLMALQKLDLDDAYPRRTCHDAEPGWFTFAGERYLETKSKAAEAPTTERSEYHWVDAIEAGLPRRVCAATYIHRNPLVAGVWDGTTWAPPPATLVRDEP